MENQSHHMNEIELVDEYDYVQICDFFRSQPNLMLFNLCLLQIQSGRAYNGTISALIQVFMKDRIWSQFQRDVILRWLKDDWINVSEKMLFQAIWASLPKTQIIEVN